MRVLGIAFVLVASFSFGFGCSAHPTGDGSEGTGVERAKLSASEQRKLAAFDPWHGDALGNAVALSDDRALLGSSLDDDEGIVDRGSAIVFVSSGTAWNAEVKFQPSDALPGDEFGSAVAISGNTAFVGAWKDDLGSNTDQGSVYVFSRSGTAWTQRQKLVAASGAALDRFGGTLALDGGTVAVGGDGAAWLYTLAGTTWIEQQKLPAPPEAVANGFGRVAISGDVLIVGSRRDTVATTPEQGSAYVYARSGSNWTLQQRLVAADGQAQDHFGTAVAVSGNTVVIGTDSASEGAAYVFVRSDVSFTQQAKLVASDRTLFDVFGSSVAVRGDVALVGAPFHEHDGRNANHGSAYLFRRSGPVWSEAQELFPGDAQNNDHFGSAVALSAQHALIGSPNDDQPYTANGSGYVFLLSQEPGGIGMICENDAACAPGSYCDGNGLCLPQKAAGRACEPTAGADCKTAGCNVCATGHCVDGICCMTGCEGGCVACSSALTGASNGTCAAVRAGSDPKGACERDASFPNSCGADGECNGEGSCRTSAPQGTRCGALSCVDDAVTDFACDATGQCVETALTCDGTGGTGGTGSGGTGATGGSGGAGGAGGTAGMGGSGGSAGSGGAMTGGSGGTGGTAAGGTTGSGGTSGTSGTGGSTNACIQVAPNGDDATALATNGQTPFRNVQPAIDFADAHRNIATTVCVAAGAACAATAEYLGPSPGDLTMRVGIGVLGRYESSSWTRCSDSETVLLPRTALGVLFGPEIASATVLDGVTVRSFAAASTAALTVDGARSVRLVDVTISQPSDFRPARAYGVDLRNDAVATIVGSRLFTDGLEESMAVRSSGARVYVSEQPSTIEAIGPGLTSAIWLQSSPGSRIEGSIISAASDSLMQPAGALHVWGDSADIRIAGNEIRGSRRGIQIEDCVGAGPQIESNVVTARAPLAQELGEPVIGLYSTPECAIHVWGSTFEAISNGEEQATAMFARGARSVINNSFVAGNHQVPPGATAAGWGLICQDCAKITNNHIDGLTDIQGPAEGRRYYSIALSVFGDTAGVLVDSNEIDGGCSAGVDGYAHAVEAAAPSVRIQNNRISGGHDCGIPVTGTATIIGITSATADIHSNVIDGGETSAIDCISGGILLNSSENETIIRNNIVSAGTCPTGANILELGGEYDFTPAVLENNDLAPGPPGTALYRDQGTIDLTTVEQVNALTDLVSRNNFSAECPLPLTEGSPCDGTGTAVGVPLRDWDGELRDPEHPDVGPDETGGGPPSNLPPHIDDIQIDPGTTITTCEKATFTVSATAPDGEPITYSFPQYGNSRAPLIVNGNQGVFGPGLAGDYHVDVRVSDPEGNGEFVTVFIHVTLDEACPPVVPDLATIRQLYCNGTCGNWGGGDGCQQEDADALCRLRTSDPSATAQSFTITTALPEPGVCCSPYPTGTNGCVDIGSQPGIAFDVGVISWSLLDSHGPGSVVTDVVCQP